MGPGRSEGEGESEARVGAGVAVKGRSGRGNGLLSRPVREGKGGREGGASWARPCGAGRWEGEKGREGAEREKPSRPMRAATEKEGRKGGRDWATSGQAGKKKGAGRGKRKSGPSGQNEREDVFSAFFFANPFSFLNSKQIQI